MDVQREAVQWQTGVWNKISDIYLREIDERFQPVVRSTVKRAELQAGESVLDLGTGTGSVAIQAEDAVGPDGRVVAVDISSDMLAHARARAGGASKVEFLEGRAEEIPAPDASFDAICSSLCLMYVIDRAAGAAECARVLRPGGRLVAAVWAGPDDADIVRFQATAGRFAPTPPVSGVGPGALADPSDFIAQLGDAGIDARVEIETVMFDFPNFDVAWDVLAGVTTAALPLERITEAKAAVREAMWPDPEQPRTFSNKTLFIVGRRR